MPHNYCYHSKKSKLIYFEFSSHCLVWLASLHRAEPSLIFWLAKIASRAEPSRAELSSSRFQPYTQSARTKCRTLLAWSEAGRISRACGVRHLESEEEQRKHPPDLQGTLCVSIMHEYAIRVHIHMLA